MASKKIVAANEIASAAVESTAIISIKGFDANLRCRGYQFEAGQTYEVGGRIKACHNGFHACPIDQHPLSVFEHYAPAGNRFWEVIQSGEQDADGNKLASAKITLQVELSLGDLARRAVEWVFARANWKDGLVATGDNEGATASGYAGAATASGYAGAATASGDAGAATASGYAGAATASGYAGAATASGYAGAATASGYAGAATASGYAGAATASGYAGAATASGYAGAATASGMQARPPPPGTRGAATASGYAGAATASGYAGAATASGYAGAATASGTCGAATASGKWGVAIGVGIGGKATASGKWGVAIGVGIGGKARAAEGNALFLLERDDSYGPDRGRIIAAWHGFAGHDDIKPDTFYQLIGGKPVEVK